MSLKISGHLFEQTKYAFEGDGLVTFRKNPLDALGNLGDALDFTIQPDGDRRR